MPRFIVETVETATARYEVIADHEHEARECFAQRPGRGPIDFDAATQLEHSVFEVEIEALRPD